MSVVGSAIIQITADVARIKKDLGQVKFAMKRMEKDIAKTGKNIRNTLDFSKVAVTFWAVARSMRSAMDFIFEGAKAEQAALAFGSLVKKMGGDVRGEFAKIKKASRGLLSEAEIRQQSSIAVSLGIPIERVAELMEIATAKSRDMGTTVTQSFGDIAKGIGRGSRLILDNLGIMLRLDDANRRYAATLGKSVANLTDYEKKQAVLNESIRQGAEALTRYDLTLLTNFEKIQKVQSSFKDLSDEIKAMTAELIVNSAWWDGLQIIFDRFSKQGRLQATLARTREQIEKTNKSLSTPKRFIESEKAFEARIKRLQDRLKELTLFERQLIDSAKVSAGGAKTPPPDLTAAEKLKVTREAFEIEKARLGVVDAMNKKGQILAQTRDQATSDILEQLSLERKRMANLEAFNKELKKSGDITRKEYLQIESQIVGVEAKIEKLNIKLMEQTGTFSEGWKTATDKMVKDFGGAFKRGEEMAKTAAGAMTDTFQTFFFDAMQGKMNSFKEYFSSFLQTIQQALAKMLAEMVVMKLIAGVTSIATASSGATSSGADSFASGATSSSSQGLSTFHDGGFVKKLHSGGLASNEVPAILQAGEGVLSGKGMSALDSLNDGKSPGGGGDTYILIQANDTQSFLDALNRNRGGVVKIFSDDLRTNGSSRRAMQGVL